VTRTHGLVALLLGIAIGACQPSPARDSLTVYAAASLQAALVRVVDAYRATAPGTAITVSTDSSAALATKIQQGAPADVFLSADTASPQRLVDLGLASGGVTPFARNHLTVIVPRGNPAGIHAIGDLARPGVKVIAAGDSVPITRYANELVQNVTGASDAERGFSAGYFANVASKEDNVAAVVAKIELGEGDAAIVYLTDARASTKVETVPVPDAVNVVATYGGVVVKASTHPAAATAFFAWLAGPDGQSILGSFGFLPPA
jgi:molybdate transport system substrate-binding protein